MEVLLFLKFSRPGVRTVGGVAQRLKVSYGTASEVVQYLVKKRKVRKVVKGNDLRKVFLELTPSGDRLATSLSLMLADIEEFLRELPEETLLSLKGGLEKVVSILHERGYITVYEMCWHCSFFRENFYPEDPRFPHFCQFMKKPLSPEVTYLECPDFLPREKVKV
jgi:DNA-binding MarR family transcriptional regulator